MKGFSVLIDALRPQWVTASEIRAESWALGGRHRGEILQGARIELNDPEVSLRRAVLLRAVIRTFNP